MGQGAPPGGPDLRPPRAFHDPELADLRSQVADRVQIFNAKQAVAAWDQRRSDPLGPHALALFWADRVEYNVGDNAVAVRYRLHTGTRLFLDDPEARDKNLMLFELLQLAREGAARAPGLWWPHREMLNRCDDLQRHYWYVGAAVSSLDAVDGPWSEVANTAASPLHVPGIVHVGLVDGSRLVCERLGRQRLDRYIVRSSASLDYYPGQPTRPYEWDVTLAEDAGDIWELITGLNQTIGSLYSGRPSDTATAS